MKWQWFKTICLAFFFPFMKQADVSASKWKKKKNLPFVFSAGSEVLATAVVWNPACTNATHLSFYLQYFLAMLLFLYLYTCRDYYLLSVCRCNVSLGNLWYEKGAPGTSWPRPCVRHVFFLMWPSQWRSEAKVFEYLFRSLCTCKKVYFWV